MHKKFEIVVQDLLDTHEALRSFEAVGDDEKVTDRLRKALSESCDLLKFMVNDSLIQSPGSGHGMWRIFERLQRDDGLVGFLAIERRILTIATDLKPHIVELMLSALRMSIEQMIERKGHLHVSWVVLLKDLSTIVCSEHALPTTDRPHRDWRRVFKRAVLAGSGGVITVVNKIARTNADFTSLQGAFDLSESAGTFLIGAAAQGALDDWAESRK
jgi:hypothetical protein